MKKYLPTAALVLLALFAGYAAKPSGPKPRLARTDTVPPAQLLEDIESLRQDNLGLKERIAGWEATPPRIVVKTDTLVTAPDTVFYPYFRASHRGLLTIPVLVSDSLPHYRPEIWRGFDISDCDDGWTVQDGQLLCNRPRLGHLWVGLDSNLNYQSDMVQLVATAGLYWRPTYRSGWDVYAAVGTDGRAYLGFRKRWELW